MSNYKTSQPQRMHPDHLCFNKAIKAIILFTKISQTVISYNMAQKKFFFNFKVEEFCQHTRKSGKNCGLGNSFSYRNKTVIILKTKLFV